jgi:hypothetical protein
MRFRTLALGEAGSVFAVVADFGRLQEWDPFVDRSEQVVGAGLEPGARYRLATPVGLTLHYELVEIDRPHRVAYRGGTKRVTSVDTISVAPLGSAVEIRFESVLHFRGWTRVIAPLVLLSLWLGGRLRTLPALRRRLPKLI